MLTHAREDRIDLMRGHGKIMLPHLHEVDVEIVQMFQRIVERGCTVTDDECHVTMHHCSGTTVTQSVLLTQWTIRTEAAVAASQWEFSRDLHNRPTVLPSAGRGQPPTRSRRAKRDSCSLRMPDRRPPRPATP